MIQLDSIIKMYWFGVISAEQLDNTNIWLDLKMCDLKEKIA